MNNPPRTPETLGAERAAGSESTLPTQIGAAVFHHYFLDGYCYGGYLKSSDEEGLSIVANTVANHTGIAKQEVVTQYGPGILTLMDELYTSFSEATKPKQ